MNENQLEVILKEFDNEVFNIHDHDLSSRFIVKVYKLAQKQTLEAVEKEIEGMRKLYFTKAELHKIIGLNEKEKLDYAYRTGREYENHKIIEEMRKKLKEL